MTSTSFNIGLNSSAKNSSRVLKPPGGGHTEIFGGAEVKINAPRPKYDQQNSSNLNFCMNTTDPNILVQQKKQEIEQKSTSPIDDAPTHGESQPQQPQEAPPAGPKRVPPGGFSSGLW